MLDSLITSKTRVKLLLKFFTNSNSTAYLRGLAEEFDESTNAIRHELNNLSKSGYLISKEDGRTILYQANVNHPLYNEVKNLVHKYLGIDKIIENVVLRLGHLYAAFIVGDYAQGKDTGTVELILVGDINDKYLRRLLAKSEGLINRRVKARVINRENMIANPEFFNKAILVWKRD